MDAVSNILLRVYGIAWGLELEAVSSWSPKAFAENKSRYLWTDAYGVCNLLSLYCRSGENKYLAYAKALANNVHDVLGKTRDGSRRLGKATDTRPLLGGLRIGKPNPEGSGMSDDGQYFHYLTKWMFALTRLTTVSGEPWWNEWAADLASVAHSHFVRDGRMFWKMSIDLSRPLVNSEGGLDPYDGLTMYKIIQDTAQDKNILVKEISEMGALVDKRYKSYSTHDALDAGEALWLTHWDPKAPWAQHVFKKAHKAVNELWDGGEFKGPPGRRLAFREFGTTIGVQFHKSLMQEEGWKERVEAIHAFWREHIFERDADITPVMYCTSLFPGVFDASFTCASQCS